MELAIGRFESEDLTSIVVSVTPFFLFLYFVLLLLSFTFPIKSMCSFLMVEGKKKEQKISSLAGSPLGVLSVINCTVTSGERGRG